MNHYTDGRDEKEAVLLILWSLLGAVVELKSICEMMVDGRDARIVAAEHRICEAMACFESPSEMSKMADVVFQRDPSVGGSEPLTRLSDET